MQLNDAVWKLLYTEQAERHSPLWSRQKMKLKF